jgi:membrane protein
MSARWTSCKRLIALWRDLFARHHLLTYASAIAFQTFIAFVALALLGLGVLGAAGDEELWRRTIGPAIAGRVLPEVYQGVEAIVAKVFSSSTTGLIAFGAGLAVWEVSGVVRAAGGALNTIYDAEETRPWWVRFPVSLALACGVIGTVMGAVILVWAVRVPGAWSWPATAGRWLAAIALLGAGFSLIVRWAPSENRAQRWATAGAALVVAGWIGETAMVGWYVRTYANFRSPIGSLEVFIFAAGVLYAAAIILLVGLELDELVRDDVREQDEQRQRLVPLARGLVLGRTGERSLSE